MNGKKSHYRHYGNYQLKILPMQSRIENDDDYAEEEKQKTNIHTFAFNTFFFSLLYCCFHFHIEYNKFNLRYLPIFIKKKFSRFYCFAHINSHRRSYFTFCFSYFFFFVPLNVSSVMDLNAKMAIAIWMTVIKNAWLFLSIFFCKKQIKLQNGFGSMLHANKEEKRNKKKKFVKRRSSHISNCYQFGNVFNRFWISSVSFCLTTIDFSLDFNLLLHEMRFLIFLYTSFISLFLSEYFKKLYKVSFYYHLNCRKKKKREFQVSTGYFRVQKLNKMFFVVFYFAQFSVGGFFFSSFNLKSRSFCSYVLKISHDRFRICLVKH